MDPALNQNLQAEIRQLVTAWLWIILLGAAELAAALSPLPHAFRPLLMVPAIAMIAGVAFQFMELRRGPPIVRAFAVAAIFWLFVLLVLGSCDPLTRTDYKIADTRAADISPAAPASR